MSTNANGSTESQGLALAATITGAVGIAALPVTWVLDAVMVGAAIALVLGIVGVIMAVRAKKQGHNPPLAKAGLITSIVSTFGGGAVFLFVLLIAGIFIASLTWGG